MELKINFNPENKADLMIVKALGVSLEVSSSSLLGKKEEPTKSESVDAAEEAPVTTAPEEPAEAPAEEPQPEEAPVEKPKRKRRTKAEIEAEKNDAPGLSEALNAKYADEVPATPEEAFQQPMTVQPELPFDAQEGTKLATMTVEEWKDLFKKKRIELGLCDENGNAEGAKNANARMDFVEFIYGLSNPYGAPKPKDLTDENRAKFYYEKFQYVQYDPAKGFYVGEPAPKKAPF